jgi:hypothetical protein
MSFVYGFVSGVVACVALVFGLLTWAAVMDWRDTVYHKRLYWGELKSRYPDRPMLPFVPQAADYFEGSWMSWWPFGPMLQRIADKAFKGA